MYNRGVQLIKDCFLLKNTGKNSDILKGLLVLLERCFNLSNVTDAKVFGATLSSPLTFLRIVYQIQPVISEGGV